MQLLDGIIGAIELQMQSMVDLCPDLGWQTAIGAFRNDPTIGLSP
ncbi:hypothetical protein PCA20602_00876 [Pandoraea capi]|uniref:Transposase n=1 Tax=Pandoraea capi TaxID=2508286 RepID=A0ABY6VQJ4_9BURK|nr:hypothetical protein [Pandoraea capi]VVD76396.1 hypothetical protein PCA20602_00876 [Pandoraea capi]